MKRSLAGISLILFAISALLLIGITLFESSLAGLSPETERMITFLLLVLPAAFGVLFGIISLIRREGRPWLAISGILLNALFAIFHLMIILFAG